MKLQFTVNNLRDALNSNNDILIRVWCTRLVKAANNAEMTALYESSSDTGTELKKNALKYIEIAERDLYVHVALKLKQYHDQLIKNEVSASIVANFISSLSFASTDDKRETINVSELKQAAKAAFRKDDKKALIRSIARALNLSSAAYERELVVVTENRVKDAKNNKDIYMGTSKKGFKTMRGAKNALTRLRKKQPNSTLKIIELGTVFAIKVIH